MFKHSCRYVVSGGNSASISTPAKLLRATAKCECKWRCCLTHNNLCLDRQGANTAQTLPQRVPSLQKQTNEKQSERAGETGIEWEFCHAYWKRAEWNYLPTSLNQFFLVIVILTVVQDYVPKCDNEKEFFGTPKWKYRAGLSKDHSLWV